MFRLNKTLRILLVTGLGVPALALLLAVGPESQPTTQPAAQELTVRVWTCPTHDQFRLSSRGDCPICETDLVRAKVTIQGPDVLGDPYVLATCPVSGLTLGEMDSPIVMMHEGREVRFCSNACISKFEADPAGYFAEIDKQIIEQQRATYPMTTCPVSKEALGSMGGPVDYVYNNRLVRFCCNGCVRGFKKDPAPVLAVLDEAIMAQQLPDYPLDTCPISGQKLGSMGEPVDYIVANRLVRFCCTGCVSMFYREPAPHLEKITMALGTVHTSHDEHGDIGHGPDHDDHDH